MRRDDQPEILDAADVPDSVARLAYRDLARIHRWLGDTAFVLRRIRQDTLPVHRILDVGCGSGAVSEHVRRKLGIEVLGVDLNPRLSAAAMVPILKADAVRDTLPRADVAYSMHLGHHLSERELIALIRNVGKFCRRFILLDLVRHPLPLALFRVFVAPFVCRIVVDDGQTSIRRSYTPGELHRITTDALRDSGGTFRQSVAPIYSRQVIDISYAPQRHRAGRQSASKAPIPAGSRSGIRYPARS
ncbi:MAG: methyltransferase domain-containing protein [Acidobacteriia bacterium]|nr:methyltransferase domain-containing protein [Terriglobia bacterium]